MNPTKPSALFLLLYLFLASLPTARAEQFGLFTYEVNDRGIIITHYQADAIGSVEIPAEIHGIPVTFIDDFAFSGCIGLTSVSIPDSVAYIGNGAFSGCTGLTSATIPGSVISIGWEDWPYSPGCFAGCTGLTSVIILDGVTFIGESTFSGCTGLTSVSIPDSVTEIGSGAFSGCTDLSSITIPQGLTSIYDSALRDCTGLTSVTIPDSVTSINSYAFSGCTGLTSVIIPDSVTSISGGAFSGCTGLTSVTIPDSVTSIGWDAFNVCTGLTSAIFLGDVPNLGRESFANAAPDFTIYHLSGSTGFTSPTWNGYPTVMLDEVTYPAAPWLVTHGLPQDTDLNQDLNGDGVSLLMAYALNLDPKAHLQNMMPTPVVNGNSLSLSFHAAAPGITYIVETSTDLQSWTTDGVNWSELAEDGHRTASVERNGPRRFLRLVVSENP